MSDIDIGKELVQALVSRISYLEFWSKGETAAKEKAQAEVEGWKKAYYVEVDKYIQLNEKLEQIIDRFYEVLELDRCDY
jgi:hypothetical protein